MSFPTPYNADLVVLDRHFDGVEKCVELIRCEERPAVVFFAKAEGSVEEAGGCEDLVAPDPRTLFQLWMPVLL